MIALAFLFAAAIGGCDPIPGADSLLSNRSTRYLFVGETHGTTETPAIFADLVCNAANERPVVVAIE